MQPSASQMAAQAGATPVRSAPLQVSVKTVEKHRANLMSKLNVHDLAGLIRVAIKHDLIFLDE
jgi:FixJ family two-component response regulator